MSNGMMLTGRQSTELFAAVHLVQTLKRMIQGVEHEGTERELYSDLAGMGELTGIISGKLESTVCANEQEEAESRMEKPGMLSDLICQLQGLHAVHGDMPAFNENMQPLGWEVSTPGPFPEDDDDPLRGQMYLCIGRVAS